MEKFSQNDQFTMNMINQIRKDLLEQREQEETEKQSKKIQNMISSGTGDDEIDQLDMHFDRFIMGELQQYKNSQEQDINQEKEVNTPNNELQKLLDIARNKMILQEMNLQSSLIPEQPYSSSSENSQHSSQNDEHDTDVQEPNSVVEVSRKPLNQDEKEFRIEYSNENGPYEGEIDPDTKLKDGWGIYSYINGEKYEGFFQDDLIDGMGKYSFLGGHEYEGDWVEGKKQGSGILKYSNGTEYRGQFEDDNYHGEGEIRYANGDFYQGEFKYGKKHGYGKFKGAGGKQGRIMIGQWENDELIV